jgi:hypothetical protein
MTVALAHKRQGSLGVAEWAGHCSVHAALEGGVVRQASVRLPRQQQLPGERGLLLRRAASRRWCSPPSDLPEPRIATSRGRDDASNRL